ncbi:MAG: tRNA (guanosine(37)-N1)-methyltransferase TrmD [Eubacteriales bacterium]|nr:tRNA (guanosine(37)-N1)-methyltransferase TrmD [Eubacteriales bacterium]
MKIDILTLFPEMFVPLRASMLGKAAERGLLTIDVTDIREYTLDKHKKTDETPYGGGPGMIMTCDPVFRALRAVGASGRKIVYMSPRGRILDEETIRRLAQEDPVILCGHYEGVDQRILDHWDMEEISVGDFVLTGGELPAMMLVDAVARMVPGVLKSDASASEESIYSGLLEHPQYTRPRSYEDQEVPAVLLSGDHEKIRLWRLEQSLRLTKERRPDLFRAFIAKADQLSKKEKKILEKVGL